MNTEYYKLCVYIYYLHGLYSILNSLLYPKNPNLKLFTIQYNGGHPKTIIF